MENLIDINELANILGLARQTVVNKISRDPGSLPPYIRVGPKVLRWKPSTIEQWFEKQEEKAAREVEKKVEREMAKTRMKRGRPTKRETVKARA